MRRNTVSSQDEESPIQTQIVPGVNTVLIMAFIQPFSLSLREEKIELKSFSLSQPLIIVLFCALTLTHTHTIKSVLMTQIFKSSVY